MVDLLLRNARTSGSADPVHIAITDQRISSVGPDVATASQTVDVDGRVVIPGLWDQHVHMTQWAIFGRRLSLSDAASANEAAMRCADALPQQDPLLAHGYQEQLWDSPATTRVLDDFCGDHPVAIVACDLHSVWANTAALRWYGWMDIPEGPLREDDAFEFQRRINVVPMDTRDTWIAEAGRAAAALGVVGFVDMEMTWNIDPWIRRMNLGFDTQRVRASIYPEWVDRTIGLGLRTGDLITDHPLLRVGPLKAIFDGSLNTRTAWCHEPYIGSETSGGLNFDLDGFRELLERADAGGLRPAIHAIGDAAISALLDLYQELVLTGNVEHAQFVADDDLHRFAELGVLACVNPQHMLDDREVADKLWGDRSRRAYRLRDMLDAGARLLFSSDAPVAPLNPWQAIQAAVERDLPGGNNPWHPDQAITVDEALAASTNCRTLAPGEPADIAILDDDPWTATGSRLRDMPVAATLLAGNFTHWQM